MTTSAEIILDSVSPDGVRLTTMELCYHRFIHSEFMTHRVFSRNSASSRAIPVAKQIKMIEEDIAYPISWPAEQKGMSGGDELTGLDLEHAQNEWRRASFNAIKHARRLVDLGLHKSVVNRLLEPFMWHRVIVTATDWDNFYGLRCSPKAMPEIRLVAEMMREVQRTSVPRLLNYGEWHTPYIQPDDLGLGDLLTPKVSAARCARVSYLTHDGKRDYDADLNLYDRLTSDDPPHASPLEHVATPTQPGYMALGNFRGWTQLRHTVLDTSQNDAKGHNLGVAMQRPSPDNFDVKKGAAVGRGPAPRIPPPPSRPEMVDHPAHYNVSPSGVECIDVVEHMSFNAGNAIKYIWRHEDKGNSIEDLKKARWYLDREIERIGDKEPDSHSESTIYVANSQEHRLLDYLANGHVSREEMSDLLSPYVRLDRG